MSLDTSNTFGRKNSHVRHSVETVNSIFYIKIQEIFHLADVQLTKVCSINFMKRWNAQVECCLNCCCASKADNCMMILNYYNQQSTKGFKGKWKLMLGFTGLVIH